jgi:choline dehydrogenase
VWQLLPFSRGHVKIKVRSFCNSSSVHYSDYRQSVDPYVKPQIKVNYFSVDHDLSVQVAGARLVRRLFHTPPFSSLSTGEVVPGEVVVPDEGKGGSDADWEKWVTDKFGAVAHPIGTIAMMKRSLGGASISLSICIRRSDHAVRVGVVNARLKVYDTSNVRVVDASIIPIQFSAHMQATLYGIAEKAADLIKADWASSPAGKVTFQHFQRNKDKL